MSEKKQRKKINKEQINDHLTCPARNTKPFFCNFPLHCSAHHLTPRRFAACKELHFLFLVVMPTRSETFLPITKLVGDVHSMSVRHRQPLLPFPRQFLTFFYPLLRLPHISKLQGPTGHPHPLGNLDVDIVLMLVCRLPPFSRTVCRN